MTLVYDDFFMTY